MTVVCICFVDGHPLEFENRINTNTDKKLIEMPDA